MKDTKEKKNLRSDWYYQFSNYSKNRYPEGWYSYVECQQQFTPSAKNKIWLSYSSCQPTNILITETETTELSNQNEFKRAPCRSTLGG